MIRLLGVLRCLLAGRHEPVRHPLSGFRCVRCGRPGADLGEFGAPGAGYVGTERRQYDRERYQPRGGGSGLKQHQGITIMVGALLIVMGTGLQAAGVFLLIGIGCSR